MTLHQAPPILGAAFFKAHGLGNDYLVFEEGASWSATPTAVSLVCDPHRGVGSDGIVALLKDPNRRHTFGQAGRQRAQQLFSDDRMVERTTDVYSNQVDTTHATDKAHHHAT